MIEMADLLADVPGMRLCIVTTLRSVEARFEFVGAKGVQFIVLPEQMRLGWRFRKSLSKVFPEWAAEDTLKCCYREIGRFDADLVHIFGTERFYGRVTELTGVPCVVWLQGVLTAYRPFFWFGMPIWERFMYPRLWWDWWHFQARVRQEQRIIRGNRYFIGRTRWDREQLSRLNEAAVYFYVNDPARAEFFEARWKPEVCSNFTLYTTTSPALLKGTQNLVAAFSHVKKRYPLAKLRIGGPIRGTLVGKRLERTITTLGLNSEVSFLGQLEPEQIVLELQRAHVFVLASAIENNPNSLFEAQIVGTPVVSTRVGGVDDLVSHRETGLLCNSGDPEAMAAAVCQIFGDNELSAVLSERERLVAHRRHAPATVLGDQMRVYEELGRKADVRAVGDNPSLVRKNRGGGS